MISMKILYLNHNIIGRSTFHRCLGLARELVLHGHQVTIMTNSTKEKFRFVNSMMEKIEIIETPDLLFGSLRTGWDLVNAIRRCIYLKDRHFDLVHAFDTRPTVIIPALFYARVFKKTPLVIDWADWWGRGGAINFRPHKILNRFFSPIETFFEEYFRKFADYTTVTSSALRKRAIGLGIPDKKIRLLLSGADIRNIYPENKIKSRKILNLPEDAFVCVFPGYVLYDLAIVLETFKLISNTNKEAILLLIGSYTDQIIEQYDLKTYKQIRIITNADRILMRKCLSASDVAFLPLSNNLANRARFPIKFGDFLACGLHIISQDVGDIGKIIKEYNLGYLSAYSSRGMSRKALWIFKNRKRLAGLRDRRIRFARENFSWARFAEILSKIYQELDKLSVNPQTQIR